MNLEFLAVLTFVVTSANAINITSAGRRDAETYERVRFEKIFCSTRAKESIATYLSQRDLLNMATIPVMSEVANFMLNRRSKILHYQNGKIHPPYLRNAYKFVSQRSFINDKECEILREQNWSPIYVILFGGEKPLNITGIAKICHIWMFTSEKDHLIIINGNLRDDDPPLILDEIPGSPMNGVIHPWNSLAYSDFFLHILTIKKINKCGCNPNCLDKLFTLPKQQLKLVILISSSDKNTQEDAKSRALRTVQTIRKNVNNAPICVVAQSDIRKNSERIWRHYMKDSWIAMFTGSDVEASTFVIDTENEIILKTKFEEWKKELFFLDTHQTIAFHFTMVNSTEPENSEQIFNQTFPDIPLSTLRLLDGSSTIGINYEVEQKSHFNQGPIYVIIGIAKNG